MTRAEVFKRNRERNSGKLICHICKKEIISEASAVREHKDNNPRDNAPKNLDAAHRSCNKKKDPSNVIKLLRIKGLTLESIYTHTRTHANENRLAIGTVAMARNIHGKSRLKDWLNKKLKKTGFMLLTDFIESGAEVAGVEMKTIESWIPPMTSSEGRYRLRVVNSLKYIMTKQMAGEYDKDSGVL